MKTLIILLLSILPILSFSQNCGYSCMENSHVDRSDYRSGEIGYFQFDYNPNGWLDSDIIRVQFCERSGAYAITQIIVRTYGSLTPQEKTATTIKIIFTIPESPNTDVCLFIWGNIKGNLEVRYLASLNKDTSKVVIPVDSIVTSVFNPFSELQKDGIAYYYTYNGEFVLSCPTKQKPNLSKGLYIVRISYFDNTFSSGKIILN